jgi:hypothetical protein
MTTTCAAFIIGLMRHCFERSHAHPSLVILESPLVAYEEADSDEENIRIRQAGVKEAFYRTLATGAGRGQVIILRTTTRPVISKTAFAGTTSRRARLAATAFSRPRLGRIHIGLYVTEIASVSGSSSGQSQSSWAAAGKRAAKCPAHLTEN